MRQISGQVFIYFFNRVQIGVGFTRKYLVHEKFLINLPRKCIQWVGLNKPHEKGAMGVPHAGKKKCNRRCVCGCHGTRVSNRCNCKCEIGVTAFWGGVSGGKYD